MQIKVFGLGDEADQQPVEEQKQTIKVKQKQKQEADGCEFC